MTVHRLSSRQLHFLQQWAFLHTVRQYSVLQLNMRWAGLPPRSRNSVMCIQASEAGTNPPDRSASGGRRHWSHPLAKLTAFYLARSRQPTCSGENLGCGVVWGDQISEAVAQGVLPPLAIGLTVWTGPKRLDTRRPAEYLTSDC